MRIFAVVLALAAPFAHAQLTPDKPTLTRVTGQPVKAVWSNGHEAELKLSRTGIVKVPVDFQVHENMCNGVTGGQFTMTFAVRADRLVWMWTKNSDNAKVGKPVVFKFGPFEDPLVRYSFVTNSYRFKYLDLSHVLPWDEIQFQDLSWLPGFTGGMLTPFTIPTWTSETMARNSQTDLTENRIFAQINDVHITPTGPLSGVIDGFGSGFTMIGSMIESFAYLGDVGSWLWRNDQGPCLINFKPNIGAANAALFQLIAALPEVYDPYLWGQDSVLDTLEPAFIEEELWYVQH